MELAACHPSGTKNFEMAFRFLATLCSSDLADDRISHYFLDIMCVVLDLSIVKFFLTIH